MRRVFLFWSLIIIILVAGITAIIYGRYRLAQTAAGEGAGRPGTGLSEGPILPEPPAVENAAEGQDLPPAGADGPDRRKIPRIEIPEVPELPEMPPVTAPPDIVLPPPPGVPMHIDVESLKAPADIPKPIEVPTDVPTP